MTGTWEGFLTVVFDMYPSKTIPCCITLQAEYLPNFIDQVEKIATDSEKANRVFIGIEKKISHEALYNAYYTFLSNEKQKEILLLQYLYQGFEIGPQWNHMLGVDCVRKVNEIRKKVFGECHRLKGLVRFEQIGPNLYYSSIHPDHRIIEPLGQHFIQRLSIQNFILHDQNRKLAFLYNTKEYQIIENITLKELTRTKEEKEYQKLWQAFFKTIAIPERKNPRLQLGYMPRRYWQDLIEKPES